MGKRCHNIVDYSTYLDHMAVCSHPLPIIEVCFPLYGQQCCLVRVFCPIGTRELYCLEVTFRQVIHCSHSSILDYEEAFLWEAGQS